MADKKWYILHIHLILANTVNGDRMMHCDFIKYLAKAALVTALLVSFTAETMSLPPNDNGENNCDADLDYDHANPNVAFLYIEKPGSGKISICIKNTDTVRFEFSVAGLKAPTTPVKQAVLAEEDPAPHTKTISFAHDSQYGGYLVTVEKKPKAAPVNKIINGTPVILQDIQFVVAVRDMKWKLDVSGGFTGSSLVDPVFALRPESDDSAKVVRELGAEDDVNLGFAGFLHIYHECLPMVAATFGLGIGENSSAQFYGGVSGRLGNIGAISVGINFRSVPRLPSGVRVGDLLQNDDNILNNLGSQMRSGFFIALSYPFLSPGEDFFSKPIKGQEEKKK